MPPFIAAAEQFIGVVEGASSVPVGHLLQRAERALLELYLTALALPEGDLSDRHDWGGRLPHEAWARVHDELQAALGACAHYWEVFDPASLGDPAGAVEGGDQPVVASLADDLADIWRDLTHGIRAWASAGVAERRDIVWVWRESFSSHWGQHLADGLRAIHWMRHVHHVE